MRTQQWREDRAITGRPLNSIILWRASGCHAELVVVTLSMLWLFQRLIQFYKILQDPTTSPAKPQLWIRRTDCKSFLLLIKYQLEHTKAIWYTPLFVFIWQDKVDITHEIFRLWETDSHSNLVFYHNTLKHHRLVVPREAQHQLRYQTVNTN
jgi:hypothetical protein